MNMCCRFGAACVGALWLCAAARAGAGPAAFGGFIPDLEPDNNTFANARSTPLDVSEVQIGILSLTPGDVDIIRVFIPVGYALTATTAPLSGPINAPFTAPDTVVAVLDEMGAVLVESDDGGSDFPTSGVIRGSVVRYYSTSNQLYGVRVRGFNGSQSGEYALMLSLTGPPPGNIIEHEPNDSPAQALGLALPWSGPLIGYLNLAPSGDQDYMSVDMERGQVLTVTTTPLDRANTFETPDTVLTVFSSDGVTSLVESDDDSSGLIGGGTPRGSTIRMVANHTGRFYIRVRGFDALAIGEYAVTACVLPRSLVPCPGDLTADGVVNSEDLALLLGGWGVCP